MEHNDEAAGVQTPPTTLIGIARRLGPGLIIAGSIVGSGELIATTKTGAEAGFSLLWLILIGCVIKVFAQVEFGRYCLVTGKTTMEGLNELPGPRLSIARRRRPIHANWFLWYWVLMTLAGIGQLGGIVGGVGQALAISLPLTDSGRQYNKATAELIAARVELAGARTQSDPDSLESSQDLSTRLEGLEQRAASLAPASRDDVYWAAGLTFMTVILLVLGRYGLIQTLSTVFVASFTLITIANLFSLQTHGEWAVSGGEFIEGFKFRLSGAAAQGERPPLATALMAFGIIGVGAAELLAYPYWCLEKGYARFTGPRDQSAAWAERARGWMRVLKWDAWCSMVIYTFATVAFYLLGAAILWRVGLNPSGTDMIATLGVMYEPVFGAWARWLFLFGAVAVLYSTFFVASAGAARVAADAIGVAGLTGRDERSLRRWVKIFCGLYPALSLLVYVFFRQPAQLVLLSGAMQAIMLPMLGGAALYFRYRRSDSRLAPGRVWDFWLWLSALGLLIAGGYTLLRTIFPGIDRLF